MSRNLPQGWECNLKSCRNFDPVGSEHSCNGGSLTICPIASGFITAHDKECLEVGSIALLDDERLLATRAYFRGKNKGTPDDKDE